MIYIYLLVQYLYYRDFIIQKLGIKWNISSYKLQNLICKLLVYIPKIEFLFFLLRIKIVWKIKQVNVKLSELLPLRLKLKNKYYKCII